MYPTDEPTVHDLHSDANTGSFGFPEELDLAMAAALGWDERPNEAELDRMFIEHMEQLDRQSVINRLVGIRQSELTADEAAEVQQLIDLGALIIDGNGDVSLPECGDRRRRAGEEVDAA